MRLTSRVAGLALVALAPLAAQATSSPTFDFYGEGPIIESASFSPSFTSGSMGLEVTAKSKGATAQVILSNTGLGVGGSLLGNSIESNTTDSLTLTFNQNVNLSGIELSFWEKDTLLTTGDRATLTWGNGKSITLGAGSLTGSTGLLYTTFSLSGVTGNSFTLSAVGSGTQFRLAGLTATPAVPEAGTWATMGLGLLGVAAVTQRRRRAE